MSEATPRAHPDNNMGNAQQKSPCIGRGRAPQISRADPVAPVIPVIPVLVFDERGARRFCRATTFEEEFFSLVSNSLSERARALCSAGPPLAWLSTFTVGVVGDHQIAISVIGDPTGQNSRAQRVKDLLAPNVYNPRFLGPVLVRAEDLDGRLVNPAKLFPSAKVFYSEAERMVGEFECDLQWRYCPRAMKRPAASG